MDQEKQYYCETLVFPGDEKNLAYIYNNFCEDIYKEMKSPSKTLLILTIMFKCFPEEYEEYLKECPHKTTDEKVGNNDDFEF